MNLQQFEIQIIDEDCLDEFRARVLTARKKNKEFCIAEGVKITEGDFGMTPQEELFAKLFNGGKELVSNMSILEMRAKREELQKIAFEARAILAGVDSEIDEQEKKNKPRQGFSRSVSPDDIGSQALNAISVRQKKMSKEDKLLAGLQALGIDAGDAAMLMSNKTIKAHLDKKDENGKVISPIENPFKNTPEQQAAVNTMNLVEAAEKAAKEEMEKIAKPFINPFTK